MNKADAIGVIDNWTNKDKFEHYFKETFCPLLPSHT